MICPASVLIGFQNNWSINLQTDYCKSSWTIIMVLKRNGRFEIHKKIQLTRILIDSLSFMGKMFAASKQLLFQNRCKDVLPKLSGDTRQDNGLNCVTKSAQPIHLYKKFWLDKMSLSHYSPNNFLTMVLTMVQFLSQLPFLGGGNGIFDH